MESLYSELRSGESLSAELRGEVSDFLRLNSHAPPGLVRQIGRVEEAELALRLVVVDGDAAREVRRAVTLTGAGPRDLELVHEELREARALAQSVPPSPWVTAPSGAETSRHTELASPACIPDVVATLASATDGIDVAGLVSLGDILRASATSTGRFHWFETSQTTVDLSLYGDRGGAAKLLFATPRFDARRVEDELSAARALLPVLAREPRRVGPGDARTYLAPAAVAELVAMLSWGCMSEASVQQGDSPLRKVRRGEARLSPLVSLSEDFLRCGVPRFNELGELAEERVPLVADGELVATLVSSKTAREYGVPSNFAAPTEVLRAPVLRGGALAATEAMRALGSGVFASNLWYLNWSDQPAGRVTGTTRYASLWVEEGVPVAPLAGARFDDTLFRILGTELEALTEASMVPDASTYDFRALGGAVVPGLLLRALAFTS